jgi:hypothetical protein
MGRINTTNLPDYVPEGKPPDARVHTISKTLNDTLSIYKIFLLQDDVQLTRLSNVLNGSARVRGAVQSGTYRVDPLAVSRSIVGACLAR